MWSSNLLRRTVMLLALAVIPAISGCTSLKPVYSEQLAATPVPVVLAYSKPAGRLEQIVQQELALHFAESTSPSVPMASISVQTSGGSPFLTSTTGPSTFSKAGVTATITVTPRDGLSTTPFRITRSAEAGFTTTSQVLADRAASNEALERAARAAAESLRLALLGALVGG